MITIIGIEGDKVYTCYNCKHFDLFGEKAVRCPHRKNFCNHHKNCKHFEFAYEKGTPFITQCLECGRDMEVVIDFILYPRRCSECVTNRQTTRYDLAHFYSKWKDCRQCMFFKRWNEEEYFAPGYCILDAPNREKSVKGMIITTLAALVEGIHYMKSTSYDEECPYYSEGVISET